MRNGFSSRIRLGSCALAAALVVGLVAAVPGASGFASGTYRGTTSQDGTDGQPLHLQLKVNKRKTKVTVVFFELSAPPCAGKGGLQYAGLTARIRRNGTFTAPSPGDGFYGDVSGSFVRRRASGTASYDVESAGCHAGDVTWSARKG